jgi:hypothetical protein
MFPVVTMAATFRSPNELSASLVNAAAFRNPSTDLVAATETTLAAAAVDAAATIGPAFRPTVEADFADLLASLVLAVRQDARVICLPLGVVQHDALQQSATVPSWITITRLWLETLRGIGYLPSALAGFTPSLFISTTHAGLGTLTICVEPSVAKTQVPLTCDATSSNGYGWTPAHPTGSVGESEQPDFSFAESIAAALLPVFEADGSIGDLLRVLADPHHARAA